jgi:glucose/mannose-6-phosphate isomerase
MFNLIKNFPEQLLQAAKIGENSLHEVKFKGAIRNVVICGLGGSGIGGNVVSELLRRELRVPVIVNKGYSLPGFVDSSTLLILCSYSGNTEETLSCADQALDKNIHTVCITSGGRLKEIADANSFGYIIVPGGFPPRACLGYAVVELLYVFYRYNLIDGKFKAFIAETARLLNAEQENIMSQTEIYTAQFESKIIIAYAEESYESTALRLKQQVNENSKMHCWYNFIPELNHNELVGWRDAALPLAAIILRSEDENARNIHRIRFTREVIEKFSKDVLEVNAVGGNSFERHFYLIHWGDWLSYYLALAQKLDPMEIDVLNRLKDHMGAIKE